jgi:hypothetical protein
VIEPVIVPVPPDRPTLSVAEFLELLAEVGHPASERTIQRTAKDGAFADRYPGWVATRSGKAWVIEPVD